MSGIKDRKKIFNHALKYINTLLLQEGSGYDTIRSMPIIKSAIKKVRKDKVRTARNKKRESALKALIKKARLTRSAKDLQAAFSALDKAAKVKLIHPNKAGRLKSRLSKGVTQTPSKIAKIPSKPPKKTTVKSKK